MAKRGDWLKADPETARVMGRKGGRASAAKRVAFRTPDYIRGYRSGFAAGKRERLRDVMSRLTCGRAESSGVVD